MQPFVNFDKRLRGNKVGQPLRVFHKFDLTPKRAQNFLDKELSKPENGRNPKLLERLLNVLGVSFDRHSEQ
jgi:hypothetical protein